MAFTNDLQNAANLVVIVDFSAKLVGQLYRALRRKKGKTQKDDVGKETGRQ